MLDVFRQEVNEFFGVRLYPVADRALAEFLRRLGLRILETVDNALELENTVARCVFDEGMAQFVAPHGCKLHCKTVVDVEVH